MIDDEDDGSLDWANVYTKKDEAPVGLSNGGGWKI